MKLGIKKLKAMGYNGENRIILSIRSLVFSQYHHVTDRQTDGRTDTPPTAKSHSIIAERDEKRLVTLCSSSMKLGLYVEAGLFSYRVFQKSTPPPPEKLFGIFSFRLSLFV